MSSLPNNHPPVKPKKTGLLLVNLGTPVSTSWWDVRRYLKEFLSDRRVVEANRVLWWLLLNGIILTLRPHKTARAYKKIWKRDSNESPLRFYTRRQARLLAEKMGSDELVIDWAMRYGTPSIDAKIQALREQGCKKITLLPLYPQYSATTTATVCDESFRSLMKMRYQPSLRVVEPYYDHPAYIDILAKSVRAHIDTLGFQPDVILASFHGLPVEYCKNGDPYYCHCHKTARLLREALGMSEEKLRMVFQSRFGPKEWLQPYAEQTVRELAADGVKNIAIIAPSFVSDCIETLEEIDIGLRETFFEGGGENFTMIPCLNDSPEHIEMLEIIAKESLGE